MGLRTRAFRPQGAKKRIERSAENFCVYFDKPVSWMTMLIYMTPEAPFETGIFCEMNPS